MTIALVSYIALGFAAIPVVLGAINLLAFRRLPAILPETRPETGQGTRPEIAVLIPARDEERTIAASVSSVLESVGVDLEVVVLDDHSSDRTREIVEEIARGDPRLRVETAPMLPAGWAGKQHACHVLAGEARQPLLVFIDSDVRLAPDALGRIAQFMKRKDLALASGFPRERTGSFFEALIVPFIHVLLLGYLPIPATRLSSATAFAAGCGQLIAVRRDAYLRAGGHAAIRASRHDGMTLPRAFRAAGLSTDIFDASDIAECRMYSGAREVWLGFSKNADEGMAKPVALPVWTVLLAAGHVLPFVMLILAALAGSVEGLAASAGAIVLLYIFRAGLAARYRQDIPILLLHPIGVLAVLAIQWTALVRMLCGRPTEWRGRSYGRSALSDEDKSA